MRIRTLSIHVAKTSMVTKKYDASLHSLLATLTAKKTNLLAFPSVICFLCFLSRQAPDPVGGLPDQTLRQDKAAAQHVARLNQLVGRQEEGGAANQPRRPEVGVHAGDNVHGGRREEAEQRAQGGKGDPCLDLIMLHVKMGGVTFLFSKKAIFKPRDWFNAPHHFDFAVPSSERMTVGC